MGSMIPKGSRVLLDTVALIYFLEENERYSKSAEKIFNRIESGQLQGVIASLVFAELLVPLYRSGDPQAATGLSNRLRNFRNLEVIPLTTEISMGAARLRADYGLRTPDAIHAATAISTQSTGILTNDKRLKMLSPEGLSIWLFDTLA
ncbi:MAG TPA: type II toxin-antitoxin system VapC family toxin [Gammaproteobacteria bacterium]|nr:type II toxin-antitoxin system VapC family toxin [Gammaproteobacteria bacterium]